MNMSDIEETDIIDLEEIPDIPKKEDVPSKQSKSDDISLLDESTIRSLFNAAEPDTITFKVKTKYVVLASCAIFALLFLYLDEVYINLIVIVLNALIVIIPSMKSCSVKHIFSML